MALPVLVLLSCGEEEPVGEVDRFGLQNLDETGLAFVRTIQEVREWEEAWADVEELGSPSPNDVFCACSPGNGLFLVLPVLSDGEVTHVVFYPLEESGAPVVVGKDCEDCPDFARSFFAARCYVPWEESGLTVSKELKRGMSRDMPLDSKAAGVVPNELRGDFRFPAEIWFEFYFVGGTWAATYNEIQKEARRILNEMPLRVPGTKYSIEENIPNDVVVVTVLDRTWEEAEYVAISAFDIILGLLRSNMNVTYVWAVYQWDRLFVGNAPGSYGDWDFPGHEEEEEEDDDEEGYDVVCPNCHRRVEACECEGVNVVIDVPAEGVELGTEFSFGIYVFGKDRSKIEFVNVQIRKAKATSWLPLGYVDLSQINKPSTMFKMFNPGIWEMRAGVTFEGINDIFYEYCSGASFTILWPSIDEFKDDPVVAAFCEEMWAKSVAFAEQNQSTHAVREFGGAVIMHSDGTITCKESPEPGKIVYLDKAGVHGELTFVETDYVDLSRWDDPRSTDPIMIGTVHTHYPLTWAAKGFSKPCGPSDADNSSVWPGVVYDYTNEVYAGDPVNNPNNPLIQWPSGPTRRVTE